MRPSPDPVAVTVTGLCCLAVWAGLSLGLVGLAHLRVRAVERATGRPARPEDESPWLWYAGASVVWLSAAVLALVGLARRSHARVGRNCLALLLGHLGVASAAAFALVALERPGRSGPDPFGLVLLACAIVLTSSVFAVAFAWLWAGRRACRLAASPHPEPAGAGPSPLERLAVYAGSAVLWPVGLVALLLYAKPHDAHVGRRAFRISLVHVELIALAVCVGLPWLVRLVTR